MIGGTVLALIPNAVPMRVAAPARIETAPAGAEIVLRCFCGGLTPPSCSCQASPMAKPKPIFRRRPASGVNLPVRVCISWGR